MIEKDRIVAELGERELLLPHLVHRALAANDRVKYYFTLLQTARLRVDQPEAEVSSLRSERLASGVDDGALDGVVESSRRLRNGWYHVPHASRLIEAIVEGVEEMLEPLDGRDPEFERRLATLRGTLGAPWQDGDGDEIPGELISAVTSGSRRDGDSLHVLVMDLHKALHQLQARIAGQTVDGARVYDLGEDDVARVRAFMAGVHGTAPLKFDHPGLGTTATRTGERLVLQNDIGTTDAHVLVVHVVERRARVTYTDVHLQRARFFLSLFETFNVSWRDLRSRSAVALEGSDAYYLCQGELAAANEEELDRFLCFLGSRLVFLIDWNRARKRLRPFVRKRDAIALLRWAADNDHGHRAFLELGGEKLIFEAMEQASSAPPRFGERLDRILGREATLDYLRFVLRTASQGLLAGRSLRLIRDEIKVELGRHFQTAQQELLGIAARLSHLVFEIAGRLHEGLLQALAGAASAELCERIARRARRWESEADALVNEGRQLVRRLAGGETYVQLLEATDDAADSLEEGAFLFGLFSPDDAGAPLLEPLERLAAQVGEAAGELVKCLHLAGTIQRGGAREDVQDFLEAVDRVFTLEHLTDDAEREATRVLIRSAPDFRQLHLLSRLARHLEGAVDSMLRCSLVLRDHILSEVLAS